MRSNRNRRLASLLCAVAGLSAAVTDSRSSPGWSVQPSHKLSTPRAAHQATPLSPALVLVTGGCSGTGCAPAERSAELLHVGTGRVEPTQAMREARVSHAAALLADGRVLVAGGWTGSATTASAELFDPHTRTFSPAASMSTPRMDATATPLLSGSILIAGGASATNRALQQAELFDRSEGRFKAAGPMQEARAHHAAVRLPDGQVLLVGGLRERHRATASAELYDPASNAFRLTGSLQQPRCKHAAVALKDGRVMVIGGSSDCEERHRIAQTEIYDPRSGRFTEGPALLNPRYKIVSATTVLPTGEVVVAGDADDVEVWTPGTAAFVKAAEGIGRRLAFSTATPTADGKVLLLGGYDNDIRPTAQTWVLDPNPARRSPAGRAVDPAQSTR